MRQQILPSHFFLLFRLMALLGVLSCSSTTFAQDQTASSKERKRFPEDALQRTLRASLQPSKTSGLVVLDLDQGVSLYEHNAHELFKPASVLKLVTTGTALDLLGPDYHFKTELRATGITGHHITSLYVIGGADPSMTQEQLWLIARKLKLRGIRSIGQIYLDPSRFHHPKPRQGQRAYEAGASALPLNFNTMTFEICPTSVGMPARVSLDPFEFPVATKGVIRTVSNKQSSYHIDEVKGVPHVAPPSQLKYTLKGSISARSTCLPVYRSVPDPLSYFGVVFRELLESIGVTVERPVEVGTTPVQSTSLFTHQSKPLSRILRDLNHYSSNFIAEQVLLILGGDTLSGFDRDVGLEQLSKYLHRLGVPEGEYSLHDASGLSHSNRITPMAIANAIAKMYGEEEYRVEFERSLAVDSRSGTLQKRRMEGVVRAKTGTIDGVSSLAGIVRNKYGRLLAFVLLQNSVRSRADAHRFEEKLVRYLYRSQS